MCIYKWELLRPPWGSDILVFLFGTNQFLPKPPVEYESVIAFRLAWKRRWEWKRYCINRFLLEPPVEFCYPSSLHALFSLAMSAISYFRYLAVYPFFLPRYIGFTCGSTALYQPFLSPLFPYAFLLIRKRALRLPILRVVRVLFFVLSQLISAIPRVLCPRLYFVILSWTTFVI